MSTNTPTEPLTPAERTHLRDFVHATREELRAAHVGPVDVLDHQASVERQMPATCGTPTYNHAQRARDIASDAAVADGRELMGVRPSPFVQDRQGLRWDSFTRTWRQ